MERDSDARSRRQTLLPHSLSDLDMLDAALFGGVLLDADPCSRDATPDKDATGFYQLTVFDALRACDKDD